MKKMPRLCGAFFESGPEADDSEDAQGFMNCGNKGGTLCKKWNACKIKIRRNNCGPFA